MYWNRRDEAPCCLALAATALVAVLAVAPRLVRAQSAYDEGGYDDECECDERGGDSGRTLGGHTYVPSSFVDWAFIVSQASSTTAAGVADFEIGSQRIAQILRRVGSEEFVYADQSLLGSVALTPWLSVAVEANGNAIIPRSRFGALFVGAHAAYGGTATAAVRLIRASRFQASVLGEYGRSWTNDIIPSLVPSSPHVRGDITSVRPALALAYTLTRRVGLQASGSFAWRWFDIAEKDRIETLTGDAALTLAMDPVPFTLLFAYQISHEYDRDISTATSLAVFGTGGTRSWGELGIVYRGRRELDIGASVQFKLDDIDDDLRWFGQLRLAYYF